MQLSFVTIFWIQGRGHNNVLISDEAAAASLASWYKWECNDITKHYQLPRSHYLLLSQYQVINWPGLRQSSHCSHQQQGQLQLIEQLQLHWRLDSYLLHPGLLTLLKGCGGLLDDCSVPESDCWRHQLVRLCHVPRDICVTPGHVWCVTWVSLSLVWCQ